MGLLDVRCESTDGAVVVSVHGEVDSGTVDVLLRVLDDGIGVAAGAPERLMVVDLDEVTYFGSAGLNAVVGAHERGAADGIAVRLVATKAEVMRPLEITKLDQVLRLYRSVASALADDRDSV
ncbi:STAS domain-containing protein [Mycobacterium sp. SMC-4]|uniref:STAS domain-containing protein n=1 Tax=Mycobacterium sp. SMC-4 TaxID=2857059 RepID=UPI003D068966